MSSNVCSTRRSGNRVRLPLKVSERATASTLPVPTATRQQVSPSTPIGQHLIHEPLVQTGDVARADGRIETWSGLYNQDRVDQSRLWPPGTLCIAIAANIADSALLAFDAFFPDSVVGFVPFHPISDTRYFEFFMRTAKAHLEQFAPSTAQKNINLAILDELLIPLPPLDEMRRIVDKIEALFGLCDGLESRLSERDETSDMLAQSLVGAV